MPASCDKPEQILASERFMPQLAAQYEARYHALIRRLGESLPANRVEIIRNEIVEATMGDNPDQLELWKYQAALNVLIDLSQQGWVFDIQNDTLTLRMENEYQDDKQMLRYRLSAERNAQFRTESVIRFIRYMEAERSFGDERISIRSLIGNSGLLINNIHAHERVCDPYIQLVTNERDEYTGYRLSDIWRYFRYTWSIPYKTMPGRNLYYLVRDRLQQHHPIIGIFALGNSVLNLTVRDDDIGWTVDAIKKNLSRRTTNSVSEQIVSGTDGRRIKTQVSIYQETQEEYHHRAEAYANQIFPLLMENIHSSIADIYVGDLNYRKQTRYPKQETVTELQKLAAVYAEKSINNKNNEKSPNWREESQTNLFKRKRASELAKLLSAQITFNRTTGSNMERLQQLLQSASGRQAINTALIANRKCKIGSNMMDIIVCGAIPPYNELLGGKLVSILACSPIVIREYYMRYASQVSEIASRMKGQKVIRDSRLVYLGTTSLYAVGSSQYNRIKVPLWDNGVLEFRRMGITEGYGTVFFSKETTNLFSRILELQDGGKRINHVFGEGTSPRFRMISRGLNSIGIRADAFLRHYSPRIVYSIDLARNTKEYLMGLSNTADYGLDLNDIQEVMNKTQYLIDYWYARWLETRLTSVDIVQRLERFRPSMLLLGNI